MPRWVRAPLLSILLAACASPAAPPPPPEEVLPPIEEAASCPPTLRFAQADFYFADLELGNSCRTLLQQEECVLGIFDDCTYRLPGESGEWRQWTGRIERSEEAASGYRVWLRPTALPPPPTGGAGHCQGELREPDILPYGALSCTGTQGLFFEKVDPEAEKIGQVKEQPRVEIVNPPSSTRELLPAFDLLSIDNRRELWMILDWEGGSAQGGVWVGPAGAGGRALRVYEQGSLFNIKGMGGRGKVLVAQRGTDQSGRLFLIDARQHTELTQADVPGEILALDALPDESAWIVAYRSFSANIASQVFLLHPDTLAPLGPALAIELYAASAVRGVSASNGVKVVVAAEARGRAPVVITADGALVKRGQVTFPGAEQRISELVAITGTDRVGLIEREMNVYYELDLVTLSQDISVAIPSFGALAHLAYDPAKDRVFVASLFGNLTYVDRRINRAVQAPIWLRYSPAGSNEEVGIAVSGLRWDAAGGLLYVLEPRLGRVDAIEPHP
ncbi:MAG: hypothetical protein IT384_06385 [Deltaproteobacteria bacterium]|nr:hypothetical protein [Deltaproteobacteria bacterium]